MYKQYIHIFILQNNTFPLWISRELYDISSKYLVVYVVGHLHFFLAFFFIPQSEKYWIMRNTYTYIPAI